MNQLVLRSFYQETRNFLGLHYCHMGCGKVALFYSRQYDKWRCCRHQMQCDFHRKRKSKEMSEALSKNIRNEKFIYKKLGSDHWNFGKHWGNSTKQKISKANTGRKPSKENLRVLSEINRGSRNPNYGKKMSEEQKRKISKTKREHPHEVSKETREKMSLVQSERAAKYGTSNNGMYKNVKNHISRNINEIEFYLQGTWEVKMAQFLNSKGILWEKSVRIPYVLNGIGRHYVPDFYLPLYDTYIEVKGLYSDKDKLKMKLVHEQNPDLCILMAFKYEIDHLEEFYEKNLQESVSRQVLS